jgi:hypothetical protein
VIGLREQWIRRGSFHTLGAASYVDATGKVGAYATAAKRSNPILRASFSALHQRIAAFFTAFLGEPVFFDDATALPGFHVFFVAGEAASRAAIAGRAHFDLQWIHALPDRPPEATLSFTLPIEEPAGGSSMAIWPARYQDSLALGISVRDLAMAHEPQVLAYSKGEIVVHDGFTLHAIGGPLASPSTGHRITLQGHGARFPEGWLLYW